MTTEEKQEMGTLAEQVLQWAASTEGRVTITETIRDVVKVTDQLTLSQRVDAKILNEPITR